MIQKDCIICGREATIKCKYCKNDYCDIHYRWHIETNKNCRQLYYRDHSDEEIKK